MKPLTKTIFTICLVVLAFWSCNPTRDRWINRKWHSLTGHYNVYFNGEQKLLDAIAQIEKSHVNDFNDVLKVYPSGTEAAAKGAGNLLDEAKKKFAATIQLHTVGSYTDEAYFGIAQTQFYKRDYYAALETFQFVNTKYKKLGYKNITTSWVARCYLGLEKPEESEAIMGLLLAEKNFAKKDIAPIYATAAEINIQLKKYAPAAENLKLALTGRLSKDQKIRYHFILGQLYLLNNKKPEALVHFNKVIAFTPSYEFEFNANINLTKIYDVNNKKSVARVRRNLKRMANDDKNIDYLDQIYFELGKLEMAAKNYTAAVDAFKKSAANSTKNKNQKAMAYLALAKYFFETKSYPLAKSYYDSTVITLDPKHKDFETINKTKITLNELINNLTVYETEDSLQRLSNLSKNALEQRIDSWIAAKKKQDEELAKLAKKQKRIQESIANNQSQIASPANTLASAGGEWYFYNAQLIASGQVDFFSAKKWGQRKNEDFWRIAAKEKPISQEEENGKSETEQNTEDNNNKGKEIEPNVTQPILTGNKDKDAWIANVPFTKEQMQTSNAKMLEALHNLGLIYYQQLQNPKESLKYFNILQAKFPASDYEPDAWYYSYKASSDLKDIKTADQNKTSLLSTYPEHPYSLLLQNKTLKIQENTANKSLDSAYEQMYLSYSKGQYLVGLNQKQQALIKFPGNSLRAKFELLAAFCYIKLGQKIEYKSQLEYIVKEFKGTPEAESAQELLNALNKDTKRDAIAKQDPEAAELDFDVATEVPFYFVFAVKDNKSDFTEFVAKISDFNQDYASADALRANAMMSNEGYQLLLVREFPNYSKAISYYKTIEATNFIKQKLNVQQPYVSIVISTVNFKKVLKENKLELFKNFFEKQLKANTQ